ncbi:hypothetical protein ABZY81_38395 [Streptomyces sp. NPDC006514]|uniref:hypothetical protein n=1 Tax=Streptomyces sp. NPDC006514 TaxID=3154308 RepID=UPI0033BB6529
MRGRTPALDWSDVVDDLIDHGVVRLIPGADTYAAPVWPTRLPHAARLDAQRGCGPRALAGTAREGNGHTWWALLDAQLRSKKRLT